MTSEIPIVCIVAVDQNFGIAKNGFIPWDVPEDMEYFRNMTTSVKNPKLKNAVIMGRKTWETIPLKFRPLKNRFNIVVSNTATQNDGSLGNVVFCKNIQDAVMYAKYSYVETIFVIGGRQIYDLFFEARLVNTIVINQFNENYQCDLQFTFNTNDYDLVDTSHGEMKDINTNKNIGVTKFVYNKKVNWEEKQYLDMLSKILYSDEHSFRETRNARTYSCFGGSLRFDLSKSFPLLTTKKMFMRGIFEELKFFLLGQTNTKILEQKGVNIWKGNTSREFLDKVGLHHLDEGDMGPLYGFQLRHYGGEYSGYSSDYTNVGYDQLANVLHLLKNDKYSRRIMMTTFNPAQISQAPLPPCHGIVIQFGIEGTNKLSCHMYQR